MQNSPRPKQLRSALLALSALLVSSAAQALPQQTGVNPNVVYTPPPAEITPKSALAKLEAVISAQHTPWDREFDLGKQSFNRGLFEDAEQHLLSAIRELKKTNKLDERMLRSRNLLGKAYVADVKYADAADAYTLALQTAKELHLEQTVDYAKTLEGLATVYAKTSQLKKAEQLYKESLKIRETAEGSSTAGTAQCLVELAELLREQKLYSEAQPVYELAVETLNKASDVPELTKAYFLDKVGNFFLEQGKMSEAHSFFTAALSLKDLYTSMYSPVDARTNGLVYYRCVNGEPNSVHSFTRGVEVEGIEIKDVAAVSTLTAQIYGPDWYLLKAEVTVHNHGKTPVSAMAETPTLTLETPKHKVMTPLDSDAIAREIGIRGDRLYNRLLHSADYDYVLSSFTTGGATTVGYTPFGPTFFNTVGTWSTFTPDWAARARASQAAMSALASSEAERGSVLVTKPAQTTIAPGESATFLIYYPYNSKFQAATLRVLLGNSVLEFPFTSKSG